eukprot:6195485-Pleurochrysis_carterae.AAC.2
MEYPVAELESRQWEWVTIYELQAVDERNARKIMDEQEMIGEDAASFTEYLQDHGRCSRNRRRGGDMGRGMAG